MLVAKFEQETLFHMENYLSFKNFHGFKFEFNFDFLEFLISLKF